MADSDEYLPIVYDALIDLSPKAYKVLKGDYDIIVPKSQARVYKKSSKIYLPLWLLQSKGVEHLVERLK